MKLRTKLLACMAILRNSLAQGNEDIRTTIKASRFDKAKTFDKISTAILHNCEKVITEKEMEKVINTSIILLIILYDRS